MIRDAGMTQVERLLPRGAGGTPGGAGIAADQGPSRSAIMTRDAGMTLVEVLVTLAIVATLAGGAALALGPRGAGSAEAEARRLAARLSLAADASLVSGQPMLLVWDAAGYGFLHWGGTPPDWQPVLGSRLARRDLAGGVALAATPAQGRLVLDPGGAAAPGAWRLTAARDTWAVAFDGVTPRLGIAAP